MAAVPTSHILYIRDRCFAAKTNLYAAGCTVRNYSAIIPEQNEMNVTDYNKDSGVVAQIPRNNDVAAWFDNERLDVPLTIDSDDGQPFWISILICIVHRSRLQLQYLVCCSDGFYSEEEVLSSRIFIRN